MGKASGYLTGVYSVIDDVALVARHISMAPAIRKMMTVRIEHSFDTFLVCESVDTPNSVGVERFPLAAEAQVYIKQCDVKEARCS